jgi:ribosomal protein S18 acetylase RimI-like enzyme
VNRHAPELPAIVLRHDVRPSDREVVRRIVESTGAFFPPEVDVAVELVDEHLSRGPEYGYHFVFADISGETAGYACYGPIACTESSYDLYWIAVLQSFRGRGLGKLLMQEVERLVGLCGGTRIYIETAGRGHYAATRAFYERCGYRVEATLKDFYAPGDDRLTFTRVL